MNNNDISSTLTVQAVLTKLKNAKEDTRFSKEIFLLEEGREDSSLKYNKKAGRRDWLIISDLYNKSANYSQRFHLENYLKFKVADGLNPDALFKSTCYRYIRNVALILYIREIVFEEPEKDLQEFFDKAKSKYEKDPHNINDVRFAAEMRKIL